MLIIKLQAEKLDATGRHISLTEVAPKQLA